MLGGSSQPAQRVPRYQQVALAPRTEKNACSKPEWVSLRLLREEGFDTFPLGWLRSLTCLSPA